MDLDQAQEEGPRLGDKWGQEGRDVHRAFWVSVGEARWCGATPGDEGKRVRREGGSHRGPANLIGVPKSGAHQDSEK